MKTLKVVFVLLFLMGTFAFKSTKSKPDRARRKVVVTDTGGHVDFQKRKLRGTEQKYVQFEETEDHGEKHERRSLEDLDLYTGSKMRMGTDPANYKSQVHDGEREIYVPRVTEDREIYTGSKSAGGTGPAIPRRSKVDEGSGDQSEMDKPGIQDGTESYTMDTGKMDTDSILYTPSKAAESYGDEIKKPEIDDPETHAGDENEKASTPAADYADEMKHGQKNRNGNYNQLSEAFEAGDVNVDQEGTGGTSRKMAAKSGAEIKGQHPSGNESDRNKVQNKKRKDDTAGKAETRPAKDIHGAGNENEMKFREKSSTDPASTVQEGHLGISVDGRIIEGSGWATAEAPAMSDVHVKEDNESRKRWSKSTSDNFGNGEGRRSNKVHSNSSGKNDGGGDRIDEGRKRMLLDEKSDASAANKPVIENGAAKNCQNIGIPLGIVVLLIMGATIGCLGTICCFKKIYNRHGYQRSAGEMSTPSRHEVRRHDVTSKGRRQTSRSKQTSIYAAFKSTVDIKEHSATGNETDRQKVQDTAMEDAVDNVKRSAGEVAHRADNKGFGGITDRIAAYHHPEAKEQPARVNESYKYALQNVEQVEDIVDKEKTRRTEDKHGASNESEAEATEMTVEDRVTGLREDKTTTSEDGEKIVGFGGITCKMAADQEPEAKEQPSVNESDTGALQNKEREIYIVEKTKTTAAGDKHGAGNECEAEPTEMTGKDRLTGLRESGTSEDEERIGGFGGITCKMAADQEPEAKEQPASVNESDTGALQNKEREAYIVEKTKTTAVGDKHGAGNECEAEATEMIGKDRVTALKDDRPGTSENRGRIAGNGGITCRMAAEQESEVKEQLAGVNMSDRSTLYYIKRDEDIVDKEKKSPAEDQHEGQAQATEVTGKDRVTAVRDVKPGSSVVGGRIGENLDIGNASDGNILQEIHPEEDVENEKRGRVEVKHHADNEGFGGITDRIASDHDRETVKQPASVNESDKGALQNTELVEDIAEKEKSRCTEDKHGATNGSETKATEMTNKDRVSGLRDEEPKTAEDGGRIVDVEENLDTDNESDGKIPESIAAGGEAVDKAKRGPVDDDHHADNEDAEENLGTGDGSDGNVPERIATGGEAVDNAKRGPADDDHPVDNEGNGGITCRMAAEQETEAKEQLASVNVSDRRALRYIEREEDVVNKEKKTPAEVKHESQAEAKEMSCKDRVTGVRDDKSGTSEDERRIGGFGGITDRIASDHDPETIELPDSVTESDKGALQNTELVEDIVAKEKTRRTEDKHGASNESEAEVTEMLDNDRLTGLRDEKPTTSEHGGKIVDVEENLDTGNESDGNIPERIATEGESVENVKGEPADVEHHADNEEIKENLDTGNESDGNIPERNTTDGEAVDNAKRGAAVDEHHADNERFGEITDRIATDHDPGTIDQLASVNESDKGTIQESELVKDIVEKEKSKRTEDKHGARNENEADTTEITGKERVTGLRNEKPTASEDGGRIVDRKENLDTGNESDGNIPERIATEGEALDNAKRGPADVERHADNERFGGITARMASDHDPEILEQPASVNESDKGFRGITWKLASDHETEAKQQPASVNESDKVALQNIEREEAVVDKAKTAAAGHKHGTGNECEGEATDTISKDGVTGERDDKPGTLEDEGRIGEINENLDTGNEKLQKIVTKVAAVNSRKRRRVQDEQQADSEGFGGITDRIAAGHDRETKVQLATVNDKGVLQNIKLIEDIVDEDKIRRTEEKHGASNESEAEANEMTGKDRVTGVRDDTSGISEDDGRISEFRGITCKLAAGHEPEARQQPASVNDSDKVALQNIESEKDTVDNAKTTAARHKHGTGNECEAEATDTNGKDGETGERDDKSGTSEDEGRISEINENLDTGNDKLQRIATEVDAVDRRKRGPAEDEHQADYERFSGITDRMVTGHNPETKQPPANVNDKGALQNIELAEDIVDKEKTRRTEDKRGASNESESEATEMTGEDRVTGVRDDKSGTSADKGRISEDRPDETRQILTRCTDLQLHTVKKNLQKQLESAIKYIVENMSESLLSGGRMADLSLEEIRTLTRNDRSPDASQQLLKSILDRDIWECWKLRKCTLHDVIRQHRYNLRSQSMKLNLSNPRLLSDIYTEPRITVTQYEHDGATGESKRQVREVEIHEILKRSNSDTGETSIRVVYGATGTGKKTLIQKIIYDWAMEMKYEEFSFVFHFKIQNLNAIKGKITLRALMLEAYPYLENYLDHLWKEPKRLLFIFDDLDRLYRSFIFSDNERHLDPQYICSGTESVRFVSDVLRCLLRGDFLRGCSVLITTRHWNQETLRHGAITDCKFQAMGFTSERVKDYFGRYLHHKQYRNEIIQLIEQNDILRNMCSNPLFCVTLVSSLESQQPQSEEQTTMPVINHTQLLFDYVAPLLQECGYDRNTTQKCLREVGKLAYRGILCNTLSFEVNALRELNTCPANFTTVFMFQDPDKESRGFVYEFTHYVIRDFLAALAHVLNTPIYRLRLILDEMFIDSLGKFRTFLLFLVGLSSRKSTKRLKLELGSVPSDVTLCVSEWLTRSVKRRLMNMDRTRTQSMFLHILYCLLEFGDNKILTEALSAFTTIKLNQLILKPLDCTVLSETLIYSEVIEELDLSSSLAQPQEIQKLEPVLHRCVILRLNQNNLQDSGVKQLVNTLKKSDCKIQSLELKSNHLTDDSLDTLFSALSTNSSLTELNLSNSSQDGKHANQFTHEKMQCLVERYSQQKDIRTPGKYSTREHCWSFLLSLYVDNHST
ncbi:uncharacterized protein LOC134339996 isoform X4 [Mobula hypostoma]|uniref:uncharacterized protein LOC134339996 isoform X4 n=1 Tax=Mobula hypostoma TaxID=723540 RepID=UPI002FC3C2C6